MNLSHKTILITGGKRVGQFVAKELADAGATLIMTYLESESEVPSQASAAYQLNLRDEKNIHTFTQRLKADGHQLDGLVNMASIFTPDPEELTADYIQNMFAINAFGTMQLSRWFATEAKARNATLTPIVSFIDWAVDHPYRHYNVYLASKAALRHYLMALQSNFAGIVRVVNIHPGMILEPDNFPEAEKKKIMANTPTQTIGDPEQAAKLVRLACELDFWVDNVYLAGGQQWRHRL